MQITRNSGQTLTLNFLNRFSENPHNIKFHEDMSTGGLRCSTQADRQDKANSPFLQFCKHT